MICAAKKEDNKCDEIATSLLTCSVCISWLLVTNFLADVHTNVFYSNERWYWFWIPTEIPKQPKSFICCSNLMIVFIVVFWNFARLSIGKLWVWKILQWANRTTIFSFRCIQSMILMLSTWSFIYHKFAINFAKPCNI